MRCIHFVAAIAFVSAFAGLTPRAAAQFTGAPPAGFGSLNVSTVGSNASQGETPGIRVSDTMLLHAALAVGAGVDSNVFYQDTGTTSSAVMHVMPQLTLTNSGRGVTPEVAFHLVLNGDYRQYYSDDKFVQDQGSAFGVGTGVGVDIGTHGAWTASIFNNFTRDVQTSYQPGTVDFRRDLEQPGARLRWRPGGGRLEELLTYTLLYDHFENANLDKADSLQHTIDLRTSFKFLPKTALFIDINQGFIHYLNNDASVRKVDSKPFHVSAGLMGLITPVLTALLSGGYGNGFYDSGPSPETFLVGAELGWIVGPFSRAKIGYERDFTNSIYGNYFDLDALYAAWNQQIGRAVLANLTTRFEHRDYHCAPGQDTASIACYTNAMGDRIDNWLGLGLDLHYLPRPWMSAGVAYQLLTNISDFSISAMTGAPAVKVSFVKHQVMGVLSVTY